MKQNKLEIYEMPMITICTVVAECGFGGSVNADADGNNGNDWGTDNGEW